MEERRGARRVRSFVIGGVLGAAAAAVAAGRRGRRSKRRHQASAGLSAFESAPCYREWLERNQADES